MYTKYTVFDIYIHMIILDCFYFCKKSDIICGLLSIYFMCTSI